MFFWFIATAVLAVAYVFRDPRFDYRLLVVGAVLPELEVVLGHAWILHTLAFSVALLVVVMLSTAGRKPRRKLLLGLPIGTFLHLVFDAAWGDSELFWWPALGTSLADRPVPSIDRGWVSVLLEVIGVVLCVRIARRSGLTTAAGRQAFARRGVLVC